MADKNELTNTIRDYIDSKEFEYKFKTWTQKTCKEMMSGFWKPIATISSIFLTIISFMFSFIFGHFNHTIDKISTTTEQLTKSVIKLESTIEYIMEPSEYKLKKHYDNKR